MGWASDHECSPVREPHPVLGFPHGPTVNVADVRLSLALQPECSLVGGVRQLPPRPSRTIERWCVAFPPENVEGRSVG